MINKETLAVGCECKGDPASAVMMAACCRFVQASAWARRSAGNGRAGRVRHRPRRQSVLQAPLSLMQRCDQPLLLLSFSLSRRRALLIVGAHGAMPGRSRACTTTFGAGLR
jgi:hypothetical protein